MSDSKGIDWRGIMRKSWQFFDMVAKPFGWYGLAILIIQLCKFAVPVAAERTFFQVTCEVASYKCRYAWDPSRDKRPGIIALVKMMGDDEQVQTEIVETPINEPTPIPKKKG